MARVVDKPIDRLLYIPTASYAPKSQTSRSLGDQRRRARYDAKQRLAIISDYFGVAAERRTLLELDRPDIKQFLNAVLQSCQHDQHVCVFMDGGNTFYLQKHLILSDFWVWLEACEQAVHNGNMTFIGSSAGSIAASSTISTAYWKGWDDPHAAGPEFSWNKESLSGAGLLDGHAFVHFDAEKHLSLIADEMNKPENDQSLVTAIPDSIAMIDCKQVVGGGCIKTGIDCDGHAVDFIPHDCTDRGQILLPRISTRSVL